MGQGSGHQTLFSLVQVPGKRPFHLELKSPVAIGDEETQVEIWRSGVTCVLQMLCFAFKVKGFYLELDIEFELRVAEFH
jgi:hypothetical protein